MFCVAAHITAFKILMALAAFQIRAVIAEPDG